MRRLPRLREWRERAALSQTELASMIGSTQTTISRIERGYPARPTTTRRLATALRVRPADLMADAEAEEGA
jgi:transcriptional regulator with XRE-family HTH domain